VAILLGRNCAVSVGGNVASARNVTFTMQAKTIDVEEFGERAAATHSVGWDATVSVELNDASDLGSIMNSLMAGTTMTVSGGAAGWSFTAVPVSISENDPVDGVATFIVECKLARAGLRF
jgi:hypothetical protein